jgi:hypothetical protein
MSSGSELVCFRGQTGSARRAVGMTRLTQSGHSKKGAYHAHLDEQDAIMDLKGWLRNLGLEHFEAA